MRFWTEAAAACLLAGCSSGPAWVGRPGVVLAQDRELPPPSDTDLVAPNRSYLIGPGDRLTVDVYGLNDLSRSVQVDVSGAVALPLAGRVEAANITAPQLAERIEERLRQGHIRNPNVTINVTESASQLVTVGGSVANPGLYPVVGRMTLLRAIARAGGTTEFARQNHVLLFRQVDGRSMAALYDLRAIRTGIYADPDIYANDVVMIDESQARRIFRDALQASGLLTAPLIALIQR